MSQSRVKLLAHISSFVVFGAIVATWLLPGSVGSWVFILIFALAFVLGPITSGRWRPSTSKGPVPKLPFKPDTSAVHASPEPADTKAVAKRIGLDG